MFGWKLVRTAVLEDLRDRLRYLESAWNSVSDENSKLRRENGRLKQEHQALFQAHENLLRQTKGEPSDSLIHDQKQRRLLGTVVPLDSPKQPEKPKQPSRGIGAPTDRRVPRWSNDESYSATNVINNVVSVATGIAVQSSFAASSSPSFDSNSSCSSPSTSVDTSSSPSCDVSL